ncbi:MAG: 7-carboxy-7-deazaguanine synthase QueE [bacterium]|nr:7-carboxy-7-deazaguanine synthase QueE [bacterium]
MSGDILIAEIFGPTIQGEGALIGLPTVFVRTGGCDYRCSWCDSLHAVSSVYRKDWVSMSSQVVWQKVRELSHGVPLMVSLSGGNPAIQPFEQLIKQGQLESYRFALETQGSLAKDWFCDLDTLVLSPKPPSSKMQSDWNVFDACLEAAGTKPEILLKIVVFDGDDYSYAREVANRYPQLPVYLQPGNHTPLSVDNDQAAIDVEGLNARFEWLVAKVTSDQWFEARVLPQLHVMFWGNKRGV